MLLSLTSNRAHVFLLITLLCCAGGCGSNVDQPKNNGSDKPVKARPISILVIDDPPLAAVVQRQWQARSTGDVKVVQATSDKMFSGDTKITADAIIYPAGMLGELVERDLIQVVPDSVLDNEKLNRRDVLTFERGPLVTWGSDVYAFSFGSPNLTLMYRRDIFEQLNISPPKTWDEYQEVAKRLSDPTQLKELQLPPDAEWSATAEPLARGWAGQLLLARAAAYARKRSRFSTLFNYQTMEPLIDREPFVRALDELVEAANLAPENHSELTPEAARQEIMQGHCAMALSWPVREPGATGDEETQSDPISISFSSLPGATEVFNFTGNSWDDRASTDETTVPLAAIAGRLGSVTTNARNANGAFSMFIELTGSSLSREIASRSQFTTLFRTSHLSRPEAWVASTMDADATQQYADVAYAENSRLSWLFSVRIPGRTKYLNALDAAVEQAKSGETTSSEALESAAKRWREITAELGIEKQRTAYANSLGL